jgi:hypothetical protein
LRAPLHSLGPQGPPKAPGLCGRSPRIRDIGTVNLSGRWYYTNGPKH